MRVGILDELKLDWTSRLAFFSWETLTGLTVCKGSSKLFSYFIASLRLFSLPFLLALMTYEPLLIGLEDPALTVILRVF